MTERTKPGSSSDHAYFRSLEQAFIELRGAPLLLSPADWQVAKTWRRRGIPLELALRVMERIFERQRGSDAKAGIRSLRYFEKAVDRSWTRVLELGGGDRESGAEDSLDVPARIESLAKALPIALEDAAEAPDRNPPWSEASVQAVAGVAERISRLSGSAREVEAELQRLDREMLDRLQEALDSETLAAVKAEAEGSLTGISARMTPEERERTLELLIRRRLRQESKLPVLSLFSREADAPR